jgi:hypothetical protein
VVDFTLVATSVITMVVFGMTAPLWSRMVPLTEPVLACGQAHGDKARKTARHKTIHLDM